MSGERDRFDEMATSVACVILGVAGTMKRHEAEDLIARLLRRVAAEEREAFAVMLDSLAAAFEERDEPIDPKLEARALRELAAAIRARGSDGE